MPYNNITKRKDGRWRYAITDISGKVRCILSRKGEKRSDFVLRCDELDRIATMDTSGNTFTDLFREWQHDYMEPKLGPAEKRILVPACEKYVLPLIGDKPAISVTQADVYHVLAAAEKEGLSPDYVKKIRSSISRPYNWAIQALGRKLVCPTRDLRYKYKQSYTDDDESRVITDDNLKRFFAAASGSKYEQYFRVMLLTGIRPSEALGLQAKDLRGNTLHIQRGVTADGHSDGKTFSARRDIPLTADAVTILQDRVSKYAFSTRSGWLFPAESGTPSINAVTCALGRICRQTGVYETGGRNGMKKLGIITPPMSCRLYDFRHTFATKCAEKKMPIKTLQKIMGHKSEQTTLKYYVDVTEKMLDEARDIIKDAFNF